MAPLYLNGTSLVLASGHATRWKRLSSLRGDTWQLPRVFLRAAGQWRGDDLLHLLLGSGLSSAHTHSDLLFEVTVQTWGQPFEKAPGWLFPLQGWPASGCKKLVRLVDMAQLFPNHSPRLPYAAGGSPAFSPRGFVAASLTRHEVKGNTSLHRGEDGGQKSQHP